MHHTLSLFAALKPHFSLLTLRVSEQSAGLRFYAAQASQQHPCCEGKKVPHGNGWAAAIFLRFTSSARRLLRQHL
jgi:hypothetical protein